jgi:hypothetical protein
MLDGAVYSPLAEIVPRLGLNCHVTAVLLVPLTEAVNCWLCPEAKLTVPGVTPTLDTVQVPRFIQPVLRVPPAAYRYTSLAPSKEVLKNMLSVSCKDVVVVWIEVLTNLHWLFSNGVWESAAFTWAPFAESQSRDILPAFKS